MKAIELIGHIDAKHRLHADVPHDLPPGRVRIVVLVADEDAASDRWPHGVAMEWRADLADSRHDLYTLEDGEPMKGPE